MKLKLICFLILTTLISLLLGCRESSQFKDLKTYIANLRTEFSQKKLLPTIDAKPPRPITYQAQKLRSPFEDVEKMPASDILNANPLQAYPINMLRFVGTLSQDKDLLGFILTPDNMLYPVRTNDLLGDHQGKIIGIDSDKLNVLEKNDTEGSPDKTKIISLQLKEVP